MTELKNEFAWSWSRHQTLETCLRRYWLSHYGAWGGWNPSAPDEVREAYIQKRLSTRAQWVGTLVHEAAEYVLKEVKESRFPRREGVVEQFRRRAHRQIGDSREGRYRFFPKKYPGFIEHYYGEGEDGSGWDEAVDAVVGQVDGLFENPVFLRLTEVPERIREVERLEQIRVGDVPVWVSLDVLVEDGRGGLVVVDWKTGAAHNPARIAGQLGIYAIYVLSRYLGVDPAHHRPSDLERVKTMYVNLRSGDREVFHLEEAHVEGALALIRSSAGRMAALEEEAQRSELVTFPQLPAGDPTCGSCPFRATCDR
ncbi:MAG: PD-(D/E)XK nuclease family protein [Deltaproteobacteria bacterium]|nr:PD-(D/E)XK nuclease family protein [Deltaproteobacteria bacterium]